MLAVLSENPLVRAIFVSLLAPATLAGILPLAIVSSWQKALGRSDFLLDYAALALAVSLTILWALLVFVLGRLLLRAPATKRLSVGANFGIGVAIVTALVIPVLFPHTVFSDFPCFLTLAIVAVVLQVALARSRAQKMRS